MGNTDRIAQRSISTATLLLRALIRGLTAEETKEGLEFYQGIS